jgi:tricorn protease
MAKFSPDGTMLAFTGEYDGGRDVYVMDARGGVPERLTYHPSGGTLLDWTPDGSRVIFSSRRLAPAYTDELYTISVEGGMPEILPVDRGSLASMSPDGNALAYNRLGRHVRTWKRYEGGLAQDVWIADFTTGEFTKITDWGGSDQFPMWGNDGAIYFSSDREDATLNLYAYDPATGTTSRLTQFTEFDVKYPSYGDGRIVFQHGPGLNVCDVATGETAPVAISIPSDRRHVRERLETPAPRTGSFALSPGGERALIVARGEVINYPTDEGDAVNLTRTSGSREKNATWSPDGRWIAFVSDRTGDEQVYLVDQRGEDEWKQITDGTYGFTNQPVWSPDSKYLVFSDKYLKLHLVDVESGGVTEIARSGYDDAWERWGIMDYVWSPDSRWVAYTSQTGNMHENIWLYDTKSGDNHQLTGDMTQDWSPSFSPCGKYLYFLSNRTFNPIMGRQDQNHIFLKLARPYAFLLRDGERSPFHDDDVAVEVEEEDSEEDEEQGEVETIIDLEGVGRRQVAVDGIDAGNYFRLTAIDGGFLYMVRDEPYWLKYQNVDDGTTDRMDLFKYVLEDREAEAILEGIANYHLSADGESLIYRAGTRYGKVEAAKGGEVGDGEIELDAIRMRIDRAEEFPQIFAEAWRIQRDWFYDPGMQGTDWPAMYEKYAPFVAGCGTRGDLNYLIGEMISELNIGHTYVSGGDFEAGAERVSTGALGASFAAADGGDYYRISEIVPGVSWDPRYRSPLDEPGVPVVEGDFLIAIDGVEVRVGDNVYARLVDKADRMVTLSTNSRPRAEGAVDMRVRALRSERGLRYRDWVDRNLAHVEERSGSGIGYIHLPNMSFAGLVEFGRSYYPQTEKRAMIIDDRFNGGGFVGDQIIDRLERELWGVTAPREGGTGRNPEQAFHGPFVVLINEETYSNGEFFSEAINRLGIAATIGVRTWGGSTGIEPHQGLVDGGRVTPPQFGLYGLDSTWPIEGWGVEPQIVVVNLPADVVAGKDTQLDYAIDYLLEMLEERGSEWEIPPVPAFPNKAKPRMSGAQ